MAEPAALDDLLKKMQQDWDERARENARYYVATGRSDWTAEEFFDSGRQTVREQILTDMENICQGKDPKQMQVLEIGCGAGRITRALAEVFGEVHAVDVSGEMIRRARRQLLVPARRVRWSAAPAAGLRRKSIRQVAHEWRQLARQMTALRFRDVKASLNWMLRARLDRRRNIFLYQNNGMDLSVVPAHLRFDFAFSMIVFQHIPSREVIENYIREVHRLLRPGALFKFQVQGGLEVDSEPGNTWLGAAISDDDAVEIARRLNFEPRYRHGAGEQYFWLWFFKNPA